MGASPSHLVQRHLYPEGLKVKRTLETLAEITLFLALCTIAAAVLLGFCGFFD